MSQRSYRTPLAFKTALEQRLKTKCKTGPELARLRQLVVFNRFLARIYHVFGDRFVLKGGYALEIRLGQARSTRDIDLRWTGRSNQMLDELRSAGQLKQPDFMFFQVEEDRHHPEILSEGLRYEGKRFRVRASIASKPYGSPFGLDIAFGEPMIHQAELVESTTNELDFIGLRPIKIPVYPVETHIAEKLHAYTLPRLRPNSRVKDLPDIALLAQSQSIPSHDLQTAMTQTFEFRNTHPLPPRLHLPPIIGRYHMPKWPEKTNFGGNTWRKSTKRQRTSWIPF